VPGRVIIISACCALAGVLFPAALQAAPEGDGTLQVDSFTSGVGAGDGQPFCPGGTRVTGGGVTSTGAPNSQVQVSGPLDQSGLTSNLTTGSVGRSWYANVYNVSGTNTFVSTAVCSAASDATIRVDPFTVPAGQTGDGQAFCPSATRLIGGGVTSTGAPNAQVQVSGPLDQSGLTANLKNGAVGRSWYANVNNVGLVQNTFVSTAICSPTSDATLRVDSFTTAAGQNGDGQPSCPTGTRIVGGGVTSTGAPSDWIQVSGPLDQSGLTANLKNGAVGRSWYANVHNTGAQNTFVSTAICAPPPASTPTTKQTCKGKAATVGASPGLHTFTGTSKKDVIVGSAGKDKINAGGGNDLVCAGGGNDKVKGGPGKDKLYGQGGRDKLIGQGGKDLLSGGGKSDTCIGGAGKDTEKSC